LQFNSYIDIVSSHILSSLLLYIHHSFVTRVTRRVPHVEQELPTFQRHLTSPLILVAFDLKLSV